MNWDAPYIISPHSSRRLYWASQYVYRSDDRGDNWTRISPDLSRNLDPFNIPIMGKVWPRDSIALNTSTTPLSNVVTIEVQAGRITVKGATKAIVEAPQIELVENATHPVVFGDELMNYLNLVVQTYATHLHPGELAAGFIPVTPAPPVPPLPSPTPSLLSQKVKAG